MIVKIGAHDDECPGMYYGILSLTGAISFRRSAKMSCKCWKVR